MVAPVDCLGPHAGPHVPHLHTSLVTTPWPRGWHPCGHGAYYRSWGILQYDVLPLEHKEREHTHDKDHDGGHQHDHDDRRLRLLGLARLAHGEV